METVMMLLAIAGISFFIGDAEGPFGVFAFLRSLLTRIPLVGSTVVKVLSCPFCLGAWTSLGLYLLTHSLSGLSVGQMIMFMAGGGFFNLLFSSYISSLIAKANQA